MTNKKGRRDFNNKRLKERNDGQEENKGKKK